MVKEKIALYETDVQYDFMLRGGALFVNGQKERIVGPYGAEAIMPNVNRLHDYAVKNGWRVLGSVDRHFYEDAELLRNEGGVFDDHCMNGAIGQLRLDVLEPQKDVYVRSKDGPLTGIRTYNEEEVDMIVNSGAQIIFEKQSYDVSTNPNFREVTEQLLNGGLKKVVVDGVATDYCVKAAVHALQMKGFQTYVVSDAIEEVNIDFDGNVDMDFGKKALEKMTEEGAKIVTTKDVLEGRI
jgi:nicotinamidase-related amidase